MILGGGGGGLSLFYSSGNTGDCGFYMGQMFFVSSRGGLLK